MLYTLYYISSYFRLDTLTTGGRTLTAAQTGRRHSDANTVKMLIVRWLNSFYQIAVNSMFAITVLIYFHNISYRHYKNSDVTSFIWKKTLFLFFAPLCLDKFTLKIIWTLFCWILLVSEILPANMSQNISEKCYLKCVFVGHFEFDLF